MIHTPSLTSFAAQLPDMVLKSKQYGDFSSRFQIIGVGQAPYSGNKDSTDNLARGNATVDLLKNLGIWTKDMLADKNLMNQIYSKVRTAVVFDKKTNTLYAFAGITKEDLDLILKRPAQSTAQSSPANTTPVPQQSQKVQLPPEVQARYTELIQQFKVVGIGTSTLASRNLAIDAAQLNAEQDYVNKAKLLSPAEESSGNWQKVLQGITTPYANTIKGITYVMVVSDPKLLQQAKKTTSK